MKILAIGDTADNNYTLKKFAKRSHIDLIDFPKKEITKTSNIQSGREYFDSLLISKQVKKIKTIKDDYDLCIVLSWAAARVAYLSGINYIMYFVGSDIGNPPFEKNNIPIYSGVKKPLPNLNWIERHFYKKVFNTAIVCVASNFDSFEVLKKYRHDGIRFDRIFVDTKLFNEKVKPINKPKKKFTFLSPGRIGKAKGMDIIWEALKLCKTDFEVLQVEWFIERTEEEKKDNEILIKNLPTQVKLIPLIRREELPNYFVWADAIMGQMYTGSTGAVERDAAFCKKPVIHYTDPNKTALIDSKEIIPSFEPKSNKSHIIAELIDKVVTSKEYREKLIQGQYDYIKKLSDPEVVIRDWENLFEKMIKKYPSINRKSSDFSLKFENLLSNLAENLIYKRTMREKNIQAWGKEDYELLTK